ncbi:phage portal protein [Actinosynnema mirum]|uniref:Uncharacterized protein n=1 Tax=Actinosynnema mirum (strain ATCC 29888 / DSM 43827 / JCM 3225 / NBRC 14064 / NCIMB 13271 / NRRL B-12336 / IMRU 3971 / 101) TaxID=446462 RepID=C6WC49_ACTMD|nr:phage portal protein [Actinosynnema mirum]ACU39437.1 protein of unknown function DUF1483 [Actinosynnema mirum DSM 43827]
MDLADEDWLKRLIAAHDDELPELQTLNSHYEGTQPLNYLHPELLNELDGRLQQVVINWPQLVVDCLDERLDLVGFRLSGSAEADAGLEEIWQHNDLDSLSQQAHVDALVMRRAYSVIGSSSEEGNDLPLVTMESPLEVYAERDPRTREIAAAVKRWEEELPTGKVQHATLYLPDKTKWYVRKNGKWELDSDYDADEHELGVVPVVPLVNRPRLQSPNGKSELAAIIPVSDAANKVATDMMVSAEFHAMPRRWALGFGPEDFTDENGRRVSMWSKIAGRIWATRKTKQDGAEVGQFPEASLENFHKTIHLLASIVGSLGALTPQTMGQQNAANPATADAIRAAETRLIKRAERRMLSFGDSHERTMRIADRIRTGVWRPELKRLEARWRDAATPTIAQAADATVKLHESGILPLPFARERLNYLPEEIRLMEQADEKAARTEQDRVFGPLKPPPPPPQPPREQPTDPQVAAEQAA